MKVGIVCDLTFNTHIGIINYFYAIKNIFNDVKLVNSVFDLDDIEILFIGNEHFGPHLKIWENVLFQKRCNLNNIKVVVFSCEKIYNSYFKHNTEIQKKLNLFENLIQYAIDIEDIDMLNTKLLRGCLSKKFINIEKNKDKLDKCAFLGNINCLSYSERKKTINQLQNNIEIVFPSRQESWEDYIKELSKYRFIFSPLGNANALNLKFYEILLAGSIPIQQVKNNTLLYYNIEKEFDDCIFFEDVDEIKEKINICKFKESKNNIWLEDEILSILRTNNVIKDI